MRTSVTLATNPKIKMFSKNSKAFGAGIGASIASVVVFVIRQTGLELPAEVEATFVALISAVVTWFFPANEPPKPAPRKPFIS